MKAAGKPERDEEAKKYGNEKPISLYPLTPEEALRRALTTPLPRRGKGPTTAKKAEEPQKDEDTT